MLYFLRVECALVLCNSVLYFSACVMRYGIVEFCDIYIFPPEELALVLCYIFLRVGFDYIEIFSKRWGFLRKVLAIKADTASILILQYQSAFHTWKNITQNSTIPERVPLAHRKI